jgi:hypothetical protein
MDTTDTLNLPYLASNQAQKHVTVNGALRMLDALVQLTVSGTSMDTLPLAPHEGECVLLSTAPNAPLESHANAVAQWTDGAWFFHAPAPGWTAIEMPSRTLHVFDNGAWQALPTMPEPNQPAQFGQVAINTSTDLENRFGVSASGSFFTHAADSHRVSVNRLSQADTASIQFKTDWQAGAEFGLLGSDQFELKVSVDGSNWSSALLVDPQTLGVSIPGSMVLEGDLMARRLNMRNDALAYLVSSMDNSHPAPVTVQTEYRFGGVRRAALGVNNVAQNFQIVMFDAAGTWRGSPITVEFAGEGSMTNAIYVDADRKVDRKSVV